MSLEVRISELAQAIGTDIKTLQGATGGGAPPAVGAVEPSGTLDGHLWFDTSSDPVFVSLYDLAVANGFVGTVQDFFDSLKGETGPQGIQGIQGLQGIQGIQGLQGIQGIQGIQGLQGDQGEVGPQGQGVPTGGSAGQVLAKNGVGDLDTSWVDLVGGGISPGGANAQIQFNDAGSFGGASGVEILDGDLSLVAHEPGGVPPAGCIKLFARSVGGRLLPAYMGPSGLDSTLQPLLARNKVAWFNPPGNATTVHQLGMVVTATGTATTANVATANIHQAMRRLEYAVTTAAVTAIAGIRAAVLQQHIGNPSTPFGGFFFVARFGPSRGIASNATRRFFAGMTSLTTAPTDVNPSTWATNGIGAGADSTDDNWHIMHRTGTGTMIKINTGIPKAYADNSEMFELTVFTAPTGTSSVTVQFIRLSDGMSFTHTITTDLPAATTLLAWQLWTSVGGTSSVVGLSVASVYLETDY